MRGCGQSSPTSNPQPTAYAIAAKYMPNALGGVSPDGQAQVVDIPNSIKEKIAPEPVSQVHNNVVSLLSAPMDKGDL